MTKKDYELVARVLRETHGAIGNASDRLTAYEDRMRVAHAMTRVLAADNPRFDPERFLSACGVER